MLEVSGPVLFLDYFRLPYRVATDSQPPPLPGLFGLRAPGTGRALWWPGEEALSDASAPELLELDGFRLFCRVLPDATAPRLEADGWKQDRLLVDAAGTARAAIRVRDGEGLLPFAPDEAIVSLWSERYRLLEAGARRRLLSSAKWTYYRIRPVLPRAVQLAVRRRYARRIDPSDSFPAWPVEPALQRLFGFLLDLVADVADDSVPWIAPWPAPFRWAVVLTHDVETAHGYEHIGRLRRIEEEHGCRSSWNLVPLRYQVSDDVVAELERSGFEVGVHGLHHDGRDLESEATLRARLPEMKAWGDRWGAVGFRSPATRRDWSLMPLLPFEYDTSFPDTDPYEPDAGGCCSWLPFMIDGLVELPITLPQDHTLLEILDADAAEIWRRKTELIRGAGGMALLITHPDYMLEAARLEAYAALLHEVARDATAWRPLPRDVARWWRRRAASSLVSDAGGWRVEGPAADEAQIVLWEKR